MGFCLTGSAQQLTAGAGARHHAPNPNPDYKIRGLFNQRAELDDIDPSREVDVTIKQPSTFQYHVKITVTMADGSVIEKSSDFQLKGVVEVDVEFYGKGHNGNGRGKIFFPRKEAGRLLREMIVRDLQCTDGHGSTATVTTNIK